MPCQTQPAIRSRALALGCVTGSALLYAVLHPPVGFGPLAWIALAPMFVALRGRGPAAAAGLAGLWAVVATLGVLPWLVSTLHGHYGWSWAGSVGFWLGVGLFSAAPFYAVCFAAVAFPAAERCRALTWTAAFVAAELLRAQLGLRSPWTPLGESLVEAERLRQLASLGGVYAVSGLVAYANAALAAHLPGLLARRTPPLRAAAGTGVAASLVVAAWLYGHARITAPAGAADELEVVVVQGNVAPDRRWKRAHATRILGRYARLTRETLSRDDGSARPALVVWPENAIQTSLADPVYGPPLRRLASAGTPLLIGAPRSERHDDGRRHFNSAALLRPEGDVAYYDKRRLLPFGETRPLGAVGALETDGELAEGIYAAGTRPGVFTVDGHALGVLICMEALYPELARELVGEGARWLVVLSNDGWLRGRGARDQHLAQSVFRAIETGRPVVRSTTTGVSAVIDAHGRISERLPADREGALRASLAIPHGPPSLYARIGDVFALGCLMLSGSMPLLALARRVHPTTLMGRGSRDSLPAA